MPWTVVIPVKPATVGKSRLGRSPDVVRALALDTIAAAVAARDVRVVVVTADAEVADAASELGAEVVPEAEASGLEAAIGAGLPADGWRAVLLGDLPALQPAELEAALSAAAEYPAAFVPDAEGTGSTLVTAAPGVAFAHRFGPGSADLHRRLGLTELELADDSGLRRDVDLAEHLEAPALGPRTRAALEAQNSVIRPDALG